MKTFMKFSEWTFNHAGRINKVSVTIVLLMAAYITGNMAAVLNGFNYTFGAISVIFLANAAKQLIDLKLFTERELNERLWNKALMIAEENMSFINRLTGKKERA